jgi:hypothetical protein
MRTSILWTFVSTLLLVLAFGNPAFAGGGNSTWLPDFDKDKHVYVDPQLKDSAPELQQLIQLEQRIIDEGRKNGLSIYVVATQAGSESLPYQYFRDSNGYRLRLPLWGKAKRDELVLLWQNAPGFPRDNYLVIVWVRFKDGTDLYASVAAAAGSRLAASGVDAQRLDDPNYGPIGPAVDQHAKDPSRAVAAIIANVNNDIDTFPERERARLADDAWWSKFWSVAWKVVLVIALLGGLIALLVRYFNAKEEADKNVKEWREKLHSSNKLAIDLRDAYVALLSETGDWSDKFAGATLARYKAASIDFADFGVRNDIANGLVVKAEKVADSYLFPSVAGFRKAVSLLTVDMVPVTETYTSVQGVPLFEAFTPRLSYHPGELLHSMEELFARINNELSSIMDAARKSLKHKNELHTLLADITGLKDKLSQAKWPLEPYAARLDDIKTNLDQAAGAALADPLDCSAELERLHSLASAVKQEMESALESGAAT